MDTMVVSQFVGEGSPRPGEPRKIPGGPLYESRDVRSLLDSGPHVLVAWTQRCQQGILNWKLADEDVCELLRIAAGSRKSFHGSEWCLQGTNGPWVACDAYLVGRKRLPRAVARIGTEFYVKFAIHCTGERLLLVSFHPSKTGGKRND